jgi:DNA topoisomerase-3
MREIAQMTGRIVERLKTSGPLGPSSGDFATLQVACPACGGQVVENYKRYACTGCEFSIAKIPGSRILAPDEAETLLRDRRIGPLQGFRSKMGRPFAAILKLTDELKLEFDFGQDDEGEGAEVVDFSDRERLGDCPKCGSGVYEHGLSYLCERSVGPQKRCDFRSGKIILQQEIEPAQMRKLLADGQTDLLDGFVSNRTRRKFKAFLVRKPDGKVEFAFAPKAGEDSPGKARDAADAAKPATARAGKTAAKRKTATARPAAKAPKTGSSARRTRKPAQS